MKQKTTILLVVLLLMGLVGCGGKAKPDRVVITYVKAPLNVPSMVEKAGGMFSEAFAEHDVGVEYAAITNGAEQTQALASGDVQFLFAVGAPSVILAAANGADIQIIGAYSSSPKAYQIITGDESIRAASDLVGKTVAGPKGTTLNELLVAYLAEGDVAVEDVEYLAMSVGDAQAALEAGQVDVALLAGTNAYQAKKAGFRVLTDGAGLIDGTVLVATSREFSENNPELVECFLDAHRTVLKTIQNDYDSAMEIAMTETGLDLAAVEELYAMYDFHAALTEQDKDSLKKTIRFMFENDMIAREIAVEDLL